MGPGTRRARRNPCAQACEEGKFEHGKRSRYRMYRRERQEEARQGLASSLWE